MNGTHTAASADYSRAMLNILSDVEEEKAQLQDTQRAILNILDDAAAERLRMREMERAVLNVLDDAETEKAQLHEAQRAVLNILEDFDSERNERRRAEEQVRALNDDLEVRVVQRTAELTAANQELEAFAYSVSHDLRAPLRAIDGFSQALLEDYEAKLDEEGKDNLHRVREASQRMGQLIDDMLKLSRATRGEADIGEVDLSALAAVVGADLARSSPERCVEVAIEPGIVVRSDGRMLRAVLENLLGNAWKFTGRREGARIGLSVRRGDGETVCSVWDNGAGFDMAYVQNLFAPFQRLHRNTEFPGNGIGLATVKRIIARLGGRVWAKGAVGEGATFSFSIPDSQKG